MTSIRPTSILHRQDGLGASPPKPRITWKGVGIAAGLWFIYTALYTVLIVMRTGYPFKWVFVGQLVDHAVLALLSIPVWLLLVRTLDGWMWRWKILLHVAIAAVYAWIGLQTMLWTTGGEARAEIAANDQWIYFALCTLYVIQFMLYHMVRSLQRLRWREQQAAELAALARERDLAALKAQINPHFLFNALNAINAMVAKDAEATRDMVTQLADLLRYSLDSEDRALVTLREEVDFARAYLDLEARRFSDRLSIDYDVDPSVLEAQVPPMVLQPLVENAVKHGIGPHEQGGRISLRIRKVGDDARESRSEPRIEVTIEDTGVGAGSDNRALDDHELDNRALENRSRDEHAPDKRTLDHHLPDEHAPYNHAADKHAPGNQALDKHSLDKHAQSHAGVGLSNTSARLEMLFGRDAALQTGRVDPHGFRVRFSIPMSVDARRRQAADTPSGATS